MVVILIFPEQCHEFGAGRDFPNLDVFIVAPSGQHEAVRRQRETAHVVVVPGEEQFQRFAGSGIPESDGSIVTSRREGLSIRRIDHRPDVVRMSPERTEQPPGFNFPNADETIDASTR
jgi:hypothetical protein